MPTGRRSCYNDISFAALQSLPPSPNIFETVAFKTKLADMFSIESEYQQSYILRSEVYEPTKKLQDRVPGKY